MKIINIEEMKPDDSSMRMYHDGKDFIIIRRADTKMTAWRNGNKVGSVKNSKWSRRERSYGTYVERRDGDIIVGFKQDIRMISMINHPDATPKDFAAFFIGEKRLIPTRINYTEEDITYLENLRRDILTPDPSKYIPHEENFCKTDRYLIATMSYFRGFTDGRFEEVFGFDMQRNQLMFVKNGNFHTFQIPGVDDLTCPCVSCDGLTLGVIGLEKTRMRLFIIDLD